MFTLLQRNRTVNVYTDHDSVDACAVYADERQKDPGYCEFHIDDYVIWCCGGYGIAKRVATELKKMGKAPKLPFRRGAWASINRC